jgi:hypothetical protein
MNILTIDNTTQDMMQLPLEVDDIRYAVLDNSDPADPDYFFLPLVFVESFTAPAAVLSIGDITIKMPLDWQILIGDSEIGDLEIVPLTSISERGFEVFVNNPLSSYRPSFENVDIVDIYSDVKWYCPKLRSGHLLAVPLSSKPNSPCAYFTKDVSRTQQIVKVQDIW